MIGKIALQSSLTNEQFTSKKKALLSDWQLRGNSRILEKPVVTFLVSRQSKKLTPSTTWFQACSAVLDTLPSDKVTILVRDGIFYHDVIRYLAQRKFETIVLSTSTCSYPEYKKDDWLSQHLVLIPKTSYKLSRHKGYAVRDQAMLDMADIVFGIAIRKNGTMLRLAKNAFRLNKFCYVVEPIEKSPMFHGNYELLNAGFPSLGLDVAPPKPFQACEGHDLLPNSNIRINQNDFLWHYTRETVGPWPDQTWPDYIESLVVNDPAAAHTAIDTLDHIIEHGEIKASNYLIRGEYPVVCLTSKVPSQIAETQRYHRHLMRWNFLPYGIGILKEKAIQCGARAVIYGQDQTYDNLDVKDRFLFQKSSSKSNDHNWEDEAEWRIPGDINLDRFINDEIVIVVPTTSEQKRLQTRTQSPVLDLSSLQK